MERYVVTGMSCAACQARVERAVGKVPGVESCAVNLLTNSMGVEGNASPDAVIRAVEDAGYGASRMADAAGRGAEGTPQGSTVRSAQEDALTDRETPALRRRLIASAGFLVVLMYFSMGHMMFGWRLPAFFAGNHVAMGLVQLLLAGAVMVVNQKFFVSGFRSLFHGAPNMDTLIALGSAAAFGYSTVMLLAMTRAQTDGNAAAVMGYMEEFYFESAAMILTLITVGKMLEAYSKGRTTDALKGLMALAPKTATLIRGGAEVIVPVEEVRAGDLFAVRPGETIPVDGVVETGESAVNEAAITGESIPVDKAPGERVTSATLNQTGFLTCRAVRVGEDTTIAQIIRMVGDAAATKAPVAKLADRISAVFVPVVIGIAVATLLIWLGVGQTPGYALARAICVLVVSCPCALGLATPVAIMVGNGVGARNGILFKTAESLQETGGVQIVALDKTGTLTTGEPVVTDILPAADITEEELLTCAAALEKKSEHPLAKAVLRRAAEEELAIPEVTDFQALTGSGLEGTLAGQSLIGGREALVMERIGGSLPTEAAALAKKLSGEGKTPLYFVRDGRYLGMIAAADAIREDSAQAVAELKKLGVRTVMLTGDNERTARAIGDRAGVDEVIAGVLPDGKAAVVQALQRYGKVAMAGDGVNDSPALSAADIGIAVGAGTDVAIDAADVVLMKSSLRDMAAGIRLSRRTYRNIVENLFWALIYNTLLIPAAAGAYAKLFGIAMNPMLGAAAMSLSSFCVVMNALRLNLVDIYSDRRDKPRRNAVQQIVLKDFAREAETKGEEAMTKTMQIEGMMCAHCEATVKKALEALDGVQSAEVSHEAGTAVVTMSGDIDDATLTKAVEDKDYQVKSVA